MANYIKEYEVLGRKYGIEDFRSPGEHFFDGKNSDGTDRPRFMLWGGGCGIGSAKTLTEANDRLYRHIYETATEKYHKTKDELKALNHVLGMLELNNNLAHFKIERKPK